MVIVRNILDRKLQVKTKLKKKIHVKAEKLYFLQI